MFNSLTEGGGAAMQKRKGRSVRPHQQAAERKRGSDVLLLSVLTDDSSRCDWWMQIQTTFRIHLEHKQDLAEGETRSWRRRRL